jgi:hypothetical protein
VHDPPMYDDEPMPLIEPARWTYDPEPSECPASCDACGEAIPAGAPIHTATARAGDDEDEHAREVSWCDACDSRGAGLGRVTKRGPGYTTTVHRCGCGCMEPAAERAA